MKIIKLARINSGGPIFINLDNVSFYVYVTSKTENTKYTQIYFGNDAHWARVEETPEEILKMINGPSVDDYLLREAIKVGGFIEEGE